MTYRPYRPWSAEELETLRSLRQEDKTKQEIASLLGRTEAAVAGKLKLLGIRRYWPWTEEDDDHLRSMWPSGQPVAAELAADFAARFDPPRTAGAILKRAAVLNLPRAPVGRPAYGSPLSYRLTAMVTQEMANEIHAAAERRQIPVSELVRALVADFLQEESNDG